FLHCVILSRKQRDPHRESRWGSVVFGPVSGVALSPAFSLTCTPETAGGVPGNRTPLRDRSACGFQSRRNLVVPLGLCRLTVTYHGTFRPPKGYGAVT